jgi:hypothetical protein
VDGLGKLGDDVLDIDDTSFLETAARTLVTPEFLFEVQPR